MIRMNKIHRQPIHTLDPRAPHYTLVFGRVAPILSIPIILSKNGKSIKRILKSASDFRLDDHDEQDAKAPQTYEPQPAAREEHHNSTWRRCTILSIPIILSDKLKTIKRILRSVSDVSLADVDAHDSPAALRCEPRPAACEGHDSRSGRRFTILSIPAILSKKCAGSNCILKAASDFRLDDQDEQDSKAAHPYA